MIELTMKILVAAAVLIAFSEISKLSLCGHFAASVSRTHHRFVRRVRGADDASGQRSRTMKSSPTTRRPSLDWPPTTHALSVL